MNNLYSRQQTRIQSKNYGTNRTEQRETCKGRFMKEIYGEKYYRINKQINRKNVSNKFNHARKMKI